MIIAIANQKGGCGKTTIAMHLAALLSESGRDVVIADADPQGSASAWSGADEAVEWPPVVGIAQASKNAHKLLRQQSELHELVIVDCPPSADANTTQSIFLVASFVVVPVLASGTDIRAVDSIIALADRARDMRETLGEDRPLPLFLLRNQHNRGRLLARQVGDVLEESGDVLKTTIQQREAYRQASALGSTAWAVGSKDSRREFSKLIKELSI